MDTQEYDPRADLTRVVDYLKAYDPEVCAEPDGFRVTVKNKAGRALRVDIDDEFTLSFGGWHTHVCPYDERDEWELLREELDGLLSSHICLVSLRCGGRQIMTTEITGTTE